MSDTPHVGFIGLGVMGSRMATTLARGGYALDVFDIDQGKTRAVAQAGAAAAASARAVAERSDVVFTSLPWPATVRDVYLGAGGVVEGARPGAILVDTSTVDPETTRAVHAAAAARGVNNVMSMGNMLVAAEGVRARGQGGDGPQGRFSRSSGRAPAASRRGRAPRCAPPDRAARPPRA